MNPPQNSITGRGFSLRVPPCPPPASPPPGIPLRTVFGFRVFALFHDDKPCEVSSPRVGFLLPSPNVDILLVLLLIGGEHIPILNDYDFIGVEKIFKKVPYMGGPYGGIAIVFGTCAWLMNVV